ncbi:MAG: hypothetical protein K9H26_00400 [Prolixibacteraceae bacterium]|nr:hypothetical protein [Prolixibacteraceae bacterium]
MDNVKILNHNYRTAKRNLCFPSLNSIQSAGIVFDGDEGLPFDLSEKLGIPITIDTLSCKEGKRPQNDNSNTVFSSDLNLLKRPPKRISKPFTEKKFDILINLTDGTNRAMNYICAKSKAKFKVSYIQAGNIFDLVIPLEKEKKHLIAAELFYVLTKLNE